MYENLLALMKKRNKTFAYIKFTMGKEKQKKSKEEKQIILK